MTAQPAGGRSVEEVLDLLNDPEFCADAGRIIAEAAAIAEQAPNPQDGQPRVGQLEQAFAFLERWGVPPPTSGELVDPDPRRRFVDAIASGRWGVVPIFPWTTNQQIKASIKKIQPVIRKQHKDALINRHVQLVRWLQTIGFDRPTITRAVFGRSKGLRRPTKAAVITRTSQDREGELYEEYRGLGLTHKQIQQRIYRRLRGSEAAASAAVRMGERRYVRRVESLNEDLAAPVHSEPLSHALTMLFRALLDEKEAMIKPHATRVRDAFVCAAVPRPTTAEYRDASPNHKALEAALSAPWGIAPLFPWTTARDLKTSVGKLRLMMRPKSQDGSGPSETARPFPFEPLSDGLISLFRVLSEGDAVVRRRAFEAIVSFIRAGAL